MRVVSVTSTQAMVRPALTAGPGALFRLPAFQAVAEAAAVVQHPLSAQRSAAARRRKAVREGHSLIDALDSLKLDLLHGAGGDAGVQTLKRRLALLDQEASGDPALDDLLEAVRLRAEVEIAKRNRF